MAHTYYASNTASDLTGGGDFDYSLLHDPDTANTLTYTVAKTSTQAFDLFTEANDPSDQGDATGSWSYELNIITGNIDHFANVFLYRVNSGGSVQAGPIEASEAGQNTTAGILTYTWSSPALGTFQAGDRVRVQVSITNTQHQDFAFDLGWNTANEEFIAPYTLAGALPHAQCVWV
jgi:hypothetical protein